MATIEGRTGTTGFRVDCRWHLLRAEGRREPDALILALHGIGEDGSVMAERFRPLVRPGRALLCPDGPLPYEIRDDSDRRREGRAWYVFTGDQTRFRADAIATGAWLETLVADAAADGLVDRRRLVLCGYSQGGYLAGILTLGSWFPARALAVFHARLKHEWLAGQAPRPSLPPILALLGRRDRVVSFDASTASVQALRAAGHDVDLEAFDSGHRLGADQVQALGRWLDARGL